MDSQNEGEPAKFIREIKDKGNFLMLYEDQSYAKSLEFLFLGMGLKDNQTCLYLSCETTHDIKKDMVLAGIDAASLKGNSLHIYDINNQKREQIIKVIEDFVRNAKSHIPRIIMRNERFTAEQQQDILWIEKFVQILLEKYDISVLNSCNVEFFDVKFMQQIISMHDYAIFAPSFGKGVAIKIHASKR